MLEGQQRHAKESQEPWATPATRKAKTEEITDSNGTFHLSKINSQNLREQGEI